MAAVRAAVPVWAEQYRQCREQAGVVAARERWAATLGAVPGFVDGDELFIKHAGLLWVARAVTRAVAGECAEAEDWLAPVAALERVIAAFPWGDVEVDILKVVYQVTIGTDVRKRGGEYYTPDWLAGEVIAGVVTRPLEQVVMDPSCGSGTFLLHAARRTLAAAEAAGMAVEEAVRGVLAHVIGMDVHPVAVALARANLLIAIGPARLRACRGLPAPDIRRGDAIGWDLRSSERRADVLIGNPPWLAYRFMTPTMQAAFHRLCAEDGLWAGGTVSTHQDLAGLFVVRAARRWLRAGGRFAFVMPGAVLDRGQFAGLRAQPGLTFTAAWDLRRVRPHPFPVGAAVIFGACSESHSKRLRATEVWTGRLPRAPGEAGPVRTPVPVGDTEETPRSAYHARFRQGATLVPRMLVLARASADGRVRSARSRYEKRPWRALEDLEEFVESSHLHPVVLGEHVTPYRLGPPGLAVLPGGPAGPGFARWWARAEAAWAAHRSSAKLSLYEQFNYQQKLAGQSPGAPLRVVYIKSGMHLAAARLVDPRAIVDHTLYWAAVESEAEAEFLLGILNAAVVTRRVRPLMAYGKDERHIDKQVWRLPIPRFDPDCAVHGELVAAARAVEAALSGQADGGRCVAVRRGVRAFLATSAEGRAIERIVEGLLGAG